MTFGPFAPTLKISPTFPITVTLSAATDPSTTNIVLTTSPTFNGGTVYAILFESMVANKICDSATDLQTLGDMASIIQSAYSQANKALKIGTPVTCQSFGTFTSGYTAETLYYGYVPLTVTSSSK